LQGQTGGSALFLFVKNRFRIYFTAVRFFIGIALIMILAACGGKKPDSAQEVRTFMANWERAVDSKSAVSLDSLVAKVENGAPVEAQKFLDELYSAPEVRSIDLRGRQFSIGEKQATVSGLLIRSGIPDSVDHLSLILLKTKKGWKLAGYRWDETKSKPDSLPPST
jgi:hypothetical protein